jgi:hypothetical protein
MENEKLQIGFRQNLQIRKWKPFLDQVVKTLEVNPSAVQLIDAAESLRFEKNLFTKTRQGLADGSITRVLELSLEEVYTVLSEMYSKLSLTKVLVAPVNSMQFAFSIPNPPTPKQLCDLVSLDGDSVYVVDPDLTSGIGVDLYNCETRPGKCYEANLWNR